MTTPFQSGEREGRRRQLYGQLLRHASCCVVQHDDEEEERSGETSSTKEECSSAAPPLLSLCRERDDETHSPYLK